MAHLKNSSKLLKSVMDIAHTQKAAFFQIKSTTKISESVGKKTHTGQDWEENDVRNLRFINSPKQTNTSWAIDLIKETPPIAVKARTVACDGGPIDALGHPKIYINLDEPGNHSCIYCGLRYYKDSSH